MQFEKCLVWSSPMLTRSLILICCAVVIPSSLRAEDPPPAYDALVAAAKKGEKVDFTRMRVAFTESKAYSPIAIDGAANQMNQAFAMLDHAGAATAAEIVLRKKFVDIAAHRIAAMSYAELEKKDKSEFHNKIYRGLIDSVLASGDGSSPEKAYVVIATDEEYEVLDHLKVRSDKQALLMQKGEHFDRLDGIDKATKKTKTLYFNVSISFRALGKLLKR